MKTFIAISIPTLIFMSVLAYHENVDIQGGVTFANNFLRQAVESL